MHTIGELSKQTGVKIPTVRYYESIGLLSKPARSTGNQRRYATQQLQQLNFIKHARDLGLSIESIRELISLSNQPEKSCSEVDQIASVHLSQVQQKIALLQRLEHELIRIVSGCKSNQIKDCYVIQSLIDHDLCGDEHIL